MCVYFMAGLMTDDERDFYRSQVKLAEAQGESLRNQDKILKEQVKISKAQAGFSEVLMFATVILALAGLAQVIYYFELFGQTLVKDSYDFLALFLLGVILFAIPMIFLTLLFRSILRNKKK